MDDGSFQGDVVFLLLAQLHICAALVEEWKPRENTYIYIYLYTKLDEGACVSWTLWTKEVSIRGIRRPLIQRCIAMRSRDSRFSAIASYLAIE